MPFQENKPLFVVLLLVTVAGANASPTVTTDNTIISTLAAHGPLDTPAMIPPNNEVITPIDSKLADISRDFLQPPATSAVLSGTQSNPVKSLPAVPAAVLMVLTGFLCVSLVRDRRVWLAALAGLLWAGHIGIQALPQLALRLSHANHSKQQLYAELTYPYYLENSHRLRSDIEGTRYIGLLRHLAGIPENKSALTFAPRRKPFGKTLSYPHKNTYLSPSATIREQCSLNLLFKCLVSISKQFICFSPAFIFDNLARGPPLLA